MRRTRNLSNFSISSPTRPKIMATVTGTIQVSRRVRTRSRTAGTRSRTCSPIIYRSYTWVPVRLIVSSSNSLVVFVINDHIHSCAQRKRMVKYSDKLWLITTEDKMCWCIIILIIICEVALCILNNFIPGFTSLLSKFCDLILSTTSRCGSESDKLLTSNIIIKKRELIRPTTKVDRYVCMPSPYDDVLCVCVLPVWRSSTSCTVTPTTTRLTVQSTVSLVILMLADITPVIQSLATSPVVQVHVQTFLCIFVSEFHLRKTYDDEYDDDDDDDEKNLTCSLITDE